MQLEKMSLPKELFRIGKGAFKGCQSLKNVAFGERLNAIEEEAFANCIILEELVFPDNMEVLRAHAFEGCIGLKKIVFGKKLEHIDDFAFASCRVLQEVKMPMHLKEIGVRAFAECKYLTKIIWAEELELEYIAQEAFLNCERLAVPELDEYVEYGKSAFKGCKSE
jgi:hypothetical protein